MPKDDSHRGFHIKHIVCQRFFSTIVYLKRDREEKKSVALLFHAAGEVILKFERNV